MNRLRMRFTNSANCWCEVDFVSCLSSKVFVHGIRESAKSFCYERIVVRVCAGTV